jgi:uracil-DNA glycosylase
LQNSSDQQRLLLVFGEKLAQSLWGSSVIRGTLHKTVNSQISTVVSLSLDELIASPQNKALAWQDLQLAKQILDAF